MNCLKAAEIIQNATVYRARVSRRRAFKTEAEALAYEAGYHGYPGTPKHDDSAGWTGYFDAEDERSTFAGADE